jgi:hypothetical protein
MVVLFLLDGCEIWCYADIIHAFSLLRTVLEVGSRP